VCPANLSDCSALKGQFYRHLRCRDSLNDVSKPLATFLAFMTNSETEGITTGI